MTVQMRNKSINYYLKMQKSTKQQTSLTASNKKSNFTLNQVIGNGTFGMVYLATNNETNEKVAIKKVFQDKRYKNREHLIIQELNHPCCIMLKQSFFTQGDSQADEVYLNLVMDYIQETLSKLIRFYRKSKQPYPPILLKVYGYQMFRALAYLQAIGICHRDIKPQNILVDPATHLLKVCDFGSAKRLVKGEPNVAYICSRYYRAPELIFGATDYSCAIDVWSMGCVLAEMVLGEPLFPGESATDQLVEIIKILGTPTLEQIKQMNPSHQEFKFPQIKSHPWVKVLAILFISSRFFKSINQTRISSIQSAKFSFTLREIDQSLLKSYFILFLMRLEKKNLRSRMSPFHHFSISRRKNFLSSQKLHINSRRLGFRNDLQPYNQQLTFQFQMLQKKIAHYVLDLKKRLGKGNFGEVFHAYDIESKKFVAVKQVSLQGKITNFESTLMQIQNEIKIMKSINSPNVVAIYDVQKTTNNLYIIMEFCNQGTLEEYLHKKSNLSESEAKMFLSQIINGFQQIVSLMVVHRDLKLQNILIHNGEAKIADFGFSKILEQENQLLQTFAGSPLYMSYQILKQMHYTQKCDIWSLGVIYYELLYGKPPWLAVSIVDLINQIENVALRFPEKPVVSRQSKELIGAMLLKDENQRISWEELFSHDFFNESMQIEEERNLKLSVQKIEGQFKNDPLRKSNAKQKIYFENPVLQNVQHAAKEQKKMKRVFEEVLDTDEYQIQQVQSPLKSNQSIEQEVQDQNPQYVQQFQQNQMEIENQKVIQRVSDWIIHRRNKSVFLNTVSQTWFDLYDRGVLSEEVCQADYYKLLFVLSKYQTMIFYRMICRLEAKQLEKQLRILQLNLRYKKFNAAQWKIFVKSKEYKTALEQIKNDFQVVKSFLGELLSKVNETLPQTSEGNLKILSICNMEMIEKQIFDPIFLATVDEILTAVKKIIRNNGQSTKELLVFATHLFNALQKKQIFKYNPNKMVDFFKYYEEIENESIVKLAQALDIN